MKRDDARRRRERVPLEYAAAGDLFPVTPTGIGGAARGDGEQALALDVRNSFARARRSAASAASSAATSTPSSEDALCFLRGSDHAASPRRYVADADEVAAPFTLFGSLQTRGRTRDRDRDRDPLRGTLLLFPGNENLPDISPAAPSRASSAAPPAARRPGASAPWRRARSSGTRPESRAASRLCCAFAPRPRLKYTSVRFTSSAARSRRSSSRSSRASLFFISAKRDSCASRRSRASRVALASLSRRRNATCGFSPRASSAAASSRLAAAPSCPAPPSSPRRRGTRSRTPSVDRLSSGATHAVLAASSFRTSSRQPPRSGSRTSFSRRRSRDARRDKREGSACASCALACADRRSRRSASRVSFRSGDLEIRRENATVRARWSAEADAVFARARALGPPRRRARVRRTSPPGEPSRSRSASCISLRARCISGTRRANSAARATDAPRRDRAQPPRRAAFPAVRPIAFGFVALGVPVPVGSSTSSSARGSDALAYSAHASSPRKASPTEQTPKAPPSLLLLLPS